MKFKWCGIQIFNQNEFNLEKISVKIAPFIKAMMDSGEYDECDYGVVIDVYQLLPKDYVTINLENKKL